MSKQQAIFYHAGCPVCVSAEQAIARSLDPERFQVEVVHLGVAKDRLAEANGAVSQRAGAGDRRAGLPHQPRSGSGGSEVAPVRSGQALV
jgi:hypothetical protein